MIVEIGQRWIDRSSEADRTLKVDSRSKINKKSKEIVWISRSEVDGG